MEEMGEKYNYGGWVFDYGMLARGGLALRNVMHDGYNLAKDMRVVRIWINPDEKDQTKVRSFCLGTEDFEDTTANPSTYLTDTKFDAPPPFNIYTEPRLTAIAGVRATYKTRSKVFGKASDDDDDHLLIEQSFIFTKYGKDPPHEPGGVLEAARVFPLIKFSYGGKKIQSIRIDYRFQVSLDLFLYRGGEQEKWLIERLKGARPMLAGIFRDKEQPPTGLKTKDIFDAVEKPVLWEVIGCGLKRGIPGDKWSQVKETLPRDRFQQAHQAPIKTSYVIRDDDKSTWDNIHMWANYRLGPWYLKKQPSAPGAFHAFHCHWRWPYFIQESGVGDRMQAFFGTVVLSPFGNPFSSALGAKQFKGIPLKGHLGGPLLDPKIPTQTIQFAITETKPPKGTKPPNKWDADQCPSEQEFAKLFLPPPRPRDIREGKEIVTWLSITVENSKTKAQGKKRFEGTVMAHGLYFAHNNELPPTHTPTAWTIGEELQKPPKPKGYKPTWRRSPNSK